MQTPASPIQLHAACLTSQGRVRPQNEDHCSISLEQRLFIVSDGMGGSNAGELASQAVALRLPRFLEQNAQHVQNWTSTAREALLVEIVLQLNQQIHSESDGRPGLQGMGATVVLAWLQDEQAYLAHLGDSRIYLLRQGQLTLLTQDHSVAAMLVQRGEITAEEARTHPTHNRITRFVGMKGPASPTVQRIPLYVGDRLLLCSDGLTGMLLETEILHCLLANREPPAACKALIEAANQAGGRDNITALIINYG
jgi:protein phosphatase